MSSVFLKDCAVFPAVADTLAGDMDVKSPMSHGLNYFGSGDGSGRVQCNLVVRCTLSDFDLWVFAATPFV
jgi:hypothetical protein